MMKLKIKTNKLIMKLKQCWKLLSFSYLYDDENIKFFWSFVWLFLYLFVLSIVEQVSVINLFKIKKVLGSSIRKFNNHLYLKFSNSCYVYLIAYLILLKFK